MGGKRASSGDLRLGDGEDASLLVGFEFATHGFGSEEASVGWGGAASEYGVQPLSDEVCDVSAEGEDPGTKACAIGCAKGVGVEVAAPILRDSGSLGAAGNEP